MTRQCIHGHMTTQCLHACMTTQCRHGNMTTQCMHGRMPTQCMHGVSAWAHGNTMATHKPARQLHMASDNPQHEPYVGIHTYCYQTWRNRYWAACWYRWDIHVLDPLPQAAEEPCTQHVTHTQHVPHLLQANAQSAGKRMFVRVCVCVCVCVCVRLQ
jgi:hypothetical protein